MNLKSIVLLILAGGILLTGCQKDLGNSSSTVEIGNTAVENRSDVPVDLTALRRGVNLSALESDEKQNDFLFKKSTFEGLVEKGFDHIRLPVDFRNFSDKNGNLDDSKMKDIDGIIKMANDHGLVVFLDFHGWYDLNIAKGDDILFMVIWKNLAERYKSYERNDMLVFELINEPHETEGGDLNMSALSSLQCTTADIIRNISPNRTICFATAEWNGPWTLSSGSYNSYRKTHMMDYDNVIVAIHTYATIEFTHQNLPWMGNQGKIVKLDDSILDELKKQLKYITDFAQETDVPVILNEFGLNTDTSTIPLEDQARYVQTIMDVLNEYDIPCTWWSYTNDFPAIYRKTSLFGKYTWNDTIVDILMAE